MLVLRPTAKLAKRMGAATLPCDAKSTGRLGDWYANLLYISRLQIVLAVSEKTLLPAVLRAKDVAALPEFLPAAVGEVLSTIGVPQVAIERELREMEQVIFSKTANRQVLGSMNDFADLLACYLEDPISLLEASLKVAESPMSMLGMEDPIRATLAAFSRPNLQLV